MEIAGYPHYENVCSNILAFFIDPEEPHKLGTLILDALASAARIDVSGGAISSNVSVEREVITDDGNRIDLLIESDNHIVLVENKIYAVVSNPFEDYAAYLNEKANGRAEHKLLLTLRPTSEGSEWCFTNLTYAEFVEQIRSLLGRYVSNAETRYLTMFLDFLNTLENLQGGTRMDQQFVKFLAERNDDLEDLLAEIARFKKELRERVRELGDSIDLENHGNVEQIFQREPNCLYDDLVHDIHVSETLVVRVETSLFAEGWEVWIQPREGNYSMLKDLLESLRIPFEEHREDNGFHHRDNFVHKYDENLDGIGALLQGLINKLATYRGA